MKKNKIFAILLVSTFIVGITGLLLVNFVISSNIIFWGFSKGLLLVLGFLLIFLFGLMLANLSFLVSFFKLLLEKNLIIENRCLCLKNKNCKIKLSWYNRLTCYQNGRIVFEIEAKNIVLYYLARIALGPVNFTSMNYIFIDLIADKFNKTIDAKAILKYINENFTFNKKDLFLRLKPHMAGILREQICINPIKISPARIKRVEREVDL